MDIVILTNFRCGSHLLMQLIAENGFTANDEVLAHCRKEIREESAQKIIEVKLDILTKTELIKQSIKENLVSYLPSKLGNSVNIIHRMQYNDVDVPLAELFPDAKFIRLTRNPIDAAISLYFARTSNQFFSFAKAPIFKFHQVPYDFKQIKKKYDRYLYAWNWEDSILPQITATVDYDELVANPKAVMNKLGKKLTGKPFKVFTQSKYEKQEDPLKAEFKQQFINDMEVKND